MRILTCKYGTFHFFLLDNQLTNMYVGLKKRSDGKPCSYENGDGDCLNDVEWIDGTAFTLDREDANVSIILIFCNDGRNLREFVKHA